MSTIRTTRRERVSRLLSSMGCSWNMSESHSSSDNSATGSVSIESLPAHELSYPCFSLTSNINDEHEDAEGNNYESDSDSDSSSHRRESAQSKASKLMSRKRAFSPSKAGDREQQYRSPQQLMLENILDSFDQLVDARIRAYARILSNHVRVLSESNNTKGARIAEYKLQTLLDVAANHLLFDSISIEFKTSISNNEKRFNDDDDIATDSTSSSMSKEKTNLSIPIELIVEIQSPRFFHECLEVIDCTGVASASAQLGHQGKLIFRAEGKLRANPVTLHESNDANICSTPTPETTPACRNNEFCNRMHSNSLFEKAEIEIDCEALLSQMMNEASKVVAMAVDLTNLAWTNNTEKQEEINMIADDTRKTANVIVDDDSSAGGDCLPQRTTGNRPRAEDDQDARAGTGMSKQVSETSFASVITNLHVLEQDEERKAKYSNVSDPSYDSSSTGSDQDQETKKCPLEDQEDECYKMKRACDIVDFVLAGDSVPWYLPSNKKLRTK